MGCCLGVEVYEQKGESALYNSIQYCTLNFNEQFILTLTHVRPILASYVRPG